MSDTMMARAAAALTEITRDLPADRLDLPTPCTEYDVRGIVNHLLFWGPSLAGSGRKESVLPVADNEKDVDLTSGDWFAALTAHLDRLVDSWREPSAWQGETPMGDVPSIPAAMIGGSIVVELVVHGWDLSVATGRRPRWDDDLLKFTYEEAERHAGLGREMGLFAEPVPTPPDASLVDRIAGVTGRDPAWQPMR